MTAIIDCNSFYCSCERLFRPHLANRPVVVLSNNDGCVIALTDEAKKIGIGMAAPYYQNRGLIEKNQVAVFSSNYNLYGDLSQRVMEVLRGMAGRDRVEVYSVDECFLDLSHLEAGSLQSFCQSCKQRVEKWTGIRVSVGVAATKVLAKLANRLAKKDKTGTGCIMILDSPEKTRQALAQTPVESVWGVGRQFAIKLQSLGLKTALDLSQLPLDWARKHLGGVVGERLIRELNGEACHSLNAPLEEKKMIATTRMFGKPVYDLNELKEAVATYVARAAEKLRRQSCASSHLDVFVVTNGRQGQAYHYNPQAKHKQATLPVATSDTGILIRYALPLVEALFEPGWKYQKAGVTLGNLVPEQVIQASLFQEMPEESNSKLMEALDNINFSHRGDRVKYASSGLERGWKMKQEKMSGRYTTRWEELFTVS